MIGKEILNYRIEALLGKGGMGSVYLGTNLTIGQKVAIKVLNDNLAGSAVIRERFKSEAKLLCSLDHPNIVKFLNYVENDDGVFLIMEYVEGITLEEFILKKNGLIVEQKAYDMFDEILGAFTYAHKHGIVHRDIKPANIIITPEGRIKILDFGIARILSESNQEEENWVVGTPAYMSPEQVAAEPVDNRSDIYSLGVLLHQMLTGRAPYDTTTLSELKIKDKVLKEPLPRMKEFYPYISDKLQRIVDKAMMKKPSDRYQNCSDFRKDLKQALRPDPVSPAVKYGLVVLLLLLVGGGIYIWDYNRLKVVYYKDYVEQWGVPQGIRKLSSSEVAHRTFSYRFEYKKRKLVRMAHVNSRGKTVEHNDSEHTERVNDIWLYYKDNGQIDYAKVLDRNGKTLFKKVYNENLKTVTFRHDDQYGTEMNLAASTTRLFGNAFDNSSGERGKISRYLLTYDENGFVTELKYAGFQNILVSDKEGIYGKKYTVDDKGRVVEEHFLGYDGQPKPNKAGLAIKKFVYDGADDWIEVRYFTADGKLSSDGNGCPVVKIENDRYGNRIKESYFDGDGKLCLRKDNLVAGNIYEIDENGDMIGWSFFGADGRPCYSKNGIAKVKDEFDKNGYVCRRTFLDTEGQPIMISDGNAILELENDDRGNTIRLAYFDTQGQPVLVKSNFHQYRAEYDSSGNQTSIFFYNIKDSFCLNDDGVIGWRTDYNDRNKVVKWTYYGLDNQPAENSNGIIMAKYAYDVRGNQTKIAFYEKDGSTLRLSNEQVAGWNSVYDENGNETERAFFDTKNAPTLIEKKYTKWKAKYDDRGNQLEIKYFGLDGNLCVTDDGYAGVRYKYDERGNVLEEFEMGADEKLASGRLIQRFQYDPSDNEVFFAVFDRNERPAENRLGYHKRIRVYDERNLLVEEYYSDVKDALVNLKDKKYAVIRYKHDGVGNFTERSYWSTSRQPAADEHGVHRYAFKYDSMQHLVWQATFDNAGKPVAYSGSSPEATAKYDNRGNLIEAVCLDGNGRIINGESGFAIQRMTYDDRNNRLSDAYFDKDGKPCLNTEELYAKAEYRYNKRNQQTENRYYDAGGSLRKKNYAISRAAYDAQGRETEYAMFDYLDKPVDNQYGYHKIVITYTPEGVPSYRKVYNAKGATVLSFRYNTRTGDWDQIGEPSPEPANKAWQSTWKGYAANCPVNYNDDIDLTSIQVGGSSCTIVFTLKQESKYDLSDSELETYAATIKELLAALRKESKLPRQVVLKAVIRDKAKREITSRNF